MLMNNIKSQSIAKKNSVNVILGFRNGAKFIDQQIKSIADQTLQVAQLYIFDDYSAKSETINLLRTIERSQISHRISYIRRKKNLGFCKNFLMGLGSIKDHSDYYAPNRPRPNNKIFFKTILTKYQVINYLLKLRQLIIGSSQFVKKKL